MSDRERSVKRWLSRLTGVLGVALLASGVMVPGSVSAPLHLLTDALIMGGTTQSTPGQGFVDTVIKDFINPVRPGTYVGTALTTPEQIVGINKSVSDGADIALAAIDQHEKDHPGEPFVVFGYSQSTMVITEVKSRLAARKAAGQSVPNVTFVGIGGGDWGSSITSRLNGLVVPVIDFTFRGAEPGVQPVDSIQIARQYDIFADTVQYVTNPFALANALLGIFVHLDYANAVSLDPTSPNYVPGTKKVVDGKTTYYWIPTPDLPLFAPLRLAGVPEPVIDVFEPFFKVLVEAGYDRTVPFNKPTPLQLIPTIAPITLGDPARRRDLGRCQQRGENRRLSLPGYAHAKAQLDDAAIASAAARAPYSDAVRAINNSIDPIAAIAAVEAPIATQINQVTNAVGIPAIANQVIDSTVFPASAWTFDNVFAPKDGAQLGPFSRIARRFLDRLTPPHDANDTASPARVASLSANDQQAANNDQQTAAKDGKGDTDGRDSPKPRKRNSETTKKTSPAADTNTATKPTSKRPTSKKPTTTTAAINSEPPKSADQPDHDSHDESPGDKASDGASDAM